MHQAPTAASTVEPTPLLELSPVHGNLSYSSSRHAFTKPRHTTGNPATAKVENQSRREESRRLQQRLGVWSLSETPLLRALDLPKENVEQGQLSACRELRLEVQRRKLDERYLEGGLVGSRSRAAADTGTSVEDERYHPLPG